MFNHTEDNTNFINFNPSINPNLGDVFKGSFCDGEVKLLPTV